MNDVASKQRYHSDDELRAAVITAFGTITSAMMSHRTWRRIKLRSENEGQHTDAPDV